MRFWAVLLLGLVPLAADAAKRSATPNRFGAIAYHRATQTWGVSHDFARARDAYVEALKQCGDAKCEVVHKFKNGCGALADGKKAIGVGSGATRAEAETRALRRCSGQNGGGECTAIAWACTR
ncbi:MAG TPA: DUF4189 domain-containing protein [Burkholderiales bacterium]|nr:DUF4189 domain-containing protein [Burkholderiales bacterium]